MSDREHQNQQMRAALGQSFEKFYGEIISFLDRLPLHSQLKSHSFMNFDQAAFWARQAIGTLVLDAPAPQQDVPPAPQETDPVPCNESCGHAVLDSAEVDAA